MKSQLRRTFGDVPCMCAGIILVMSAAAVASSSQSDATSAVTNPRADPPPRVIPATRAMSVTGTAWKADNTPIAYAKVRLRNVSTGKIQGSSTANERGQFLFADIDSGSYNVELISDSGRILAISPTLAVGPGETVATFVRLGAKIPWFDGFFGNAAFAVTSAAAATGITALALDQMPCASPPCGHK